MQFTGQYIYAYAKRKTSSAQVRMYENGTGKIIINGREIKDFVTDPYLIDVLTFPLKYTERLKSVDLSILVKGGGKSGQVDAARSGIARALLKSDESLKGMLRQAGLLSIDARVVERKKPGKRKARKSAQWSKR